MEPAVRIAMIWLTILLGFPLVVFANEAGYISIQTPIQNIKDEDDFTYTLLSDHGYYIGISKSITFEVKACQDAYIGLMGTKDNTKSLFTVAIGTSKNRKCIIYDGKKSFRLNDFKGSNFLDCSSFKKYRVEWTNRMIRLSESLDGIVWHEILSYPIHDNAVINYLGVTTSLHSVGEWRIYRNVFEWCGIQLHMKPRNWVEAKHACEKNGRTLVHLHDSAQENYISSLIRSSLRKIDIQIGYTIWNGLFIDQDGFLRDVGCDTYYTQDYSEGGQLTGKGKCVLQNLQDSAVFEDDCQTKKKKFLCQASYLNCYTRTYLDLHSKIRNGIDPYTAVPAAKMEQCSTLCTSQCLGFSHDASLCHLYSSKSCPCNGRPGFYYTKGVLNRDDDVYEPGIMNVLDLCRDQVISSTATTMMASTSTSSVYHTTETYRQSFTYSTVQQTGYLETSYDPSSLLNTEEISTPFLTNKLTGSSIGKGISESPLTVQPRISSISMPFFYTVTDSSISKVISESRLTIHPGTSFISIHSVIYTDTCDVNASQCYLNGTISDCNCFCDVEQTVVIPQEQLKQEIQALKEKLTVTKQALSSWTRKKTSASDDRTSSKGIGYIAVAMMATVLGAMVIMDAPVLVSQLWRLIRMIVCCKYIPQTRRNVRTSTI